MKTSENSASYAHILKYAGVFGGVQGLNILIGLVRNKLVALLLGPGGMGLMAIFNSAAKLLSDSTNMGISMTATRDISEAYAAGDVTRLAEGVKMVRAWSFLTALLGLFVCVLLSPLLDSWTFSWGNHTLHYVLLSPVVALTAITGGELAILKGTRKLRPLALISVYGAIGSLITSIPLYYIWGETAIVPALVIVAIVQMGLTVGVSYKHHPLRLSYSSEILRKGKAMIRLGVAFFLAGMFASGADFMIRASLNHAGSLEVVGLYNIGYMIAMTYGGIIFSTLESDYYPRLVAACGSTINQNLTVNKQIEVTLLLVSPMLAFLIVMTPILIPLLFSMKFSPVISMTKLALLSIYFRSITLPIEYLNLAHGKAFSYMSLEFIYAILLAFFVILGYKLWGLTGTGIGLLATMTANLCIVLLFFHRTYKYVMSRRLVCSAIIQILTGILVCYVTFTFDGFPYWLAGVAIILLTLGYSLYMLWKLGIRINRRKLKA